MNLINPVTLKGNDTMNVYATNDTKGGFDFQGSFESIEDAMDWNMDKGIHYDHWWSDVEETKRPEWTFYPNYI
jgi:hypothetical protein